MTTIEFIIKHKVKYSALANLLQISEASVKNKLHAIGKSKPFTPEQLDSLYHFVQTIGADVEQVHQTTLHQLREDIKRKCKDIREYRLMNDGTDDFNPSQREH